MNHYDFKNKDFANDNVGKNKNKPRKSAGGIWKSSFYWIFLLAFIVFAGWIFLSSKFTLIKEVIIVWVKNPTENEIFQENLVKKGTDFSGENGNEKETDQNKNIQEKEENEIREAINFYLSQSRFRNFVLFKEKPLESLLKEKFYFVKKVNVTKQFPNKILIQVEENKSKIIWCFQENCSLIQADGRSFLDFNKNNISAEVAEFQDKDLPWVIYEDGKEASLYDLNQKPLPAGFLVFCEDLKKALDNKDFLKFENEFKVLSPISLDLKVKIENGPMVFFSSDRSAAGLAQVMEDFLKNEITLEKIKSLDYIDLRIKGKVIYKFMGEEKSQEK